MSPSLSKSPKAQPREAQGVEIPVPALSDTSSKWPLQKISIEQLTLRIPCFGFQLFDFGIHVSVADENVGPAIIVHVKKAAAPSQVLRVHSQASGKSGIFKIPAPAIVVERGSIPGEVGLNNVQIAVKIIVCS